MTRRIERVEKNLQRIVGQIIDEELQPPDLVSVMAVSCDADLTSANVSVSIFATASNAEPTLRYLQQRSNFVRRELAARAKMRRTPRIQFVLDTSLEDGQAMIDLISDTSPGR